MAEIFIDAEIAEAYQRLKTHLTQSKCKVTAEEPPLSISVVQGSIWGTTAKAAQKNVTYTLQTVQKGTKITIKSALTKKYLNFTIAGVLFSIVLLGVCLWMALDLQAGFHGFWGWLTQGDPDKSASFTRLCWILSGFLVATLAAEAAVLFRIHRSIETWAHETLKPWKNSYLLGNRHTSP